MQATLNGERTLTELDFARLTQRDGQLPVELRDHCKVFSLVPPREVPADIVTMNSQLEIVDTRSRRSQRLTICYPADAVPNLGCISVLSPVGAALIGQRLGAIARWRTPHGDECSAEIAAVWCQPEASGDYRI
ncbi:MAG: GreA/GreB family elongation factor [Desulfobacterales bacterium]|nr:GreA/GreB family elongation factor [Desulfobacterales bacterium]